MFFRTKLKLYFTAFAVGIIAMDVTGMVFGLYDIMMGGIIGFMGIFFMVVMFMWQKKKNYPNIVTIREQRGNVDIEDSDIARRIVKPDGTTTYELYYRMEEIKPPKFEDMVTGVGGNNKIYLYQLEDRSYLPIKFKLDPDNPIQKTGGQEDLHFYARQLETAVRESAGKKAWFQEFAPILLIIVTGIIMMGILWVSIPPLLQIAQSVGDSVSTSAQMQTQLINFLKNSTAYDYPALPIVENITY